MLRDFLFEILHYLLHHKIVHFPLVYIHSLLPRYETVMDSRVVIRHKFETLYFLPVRNSLFQLTEILEFLYDLLLQRIRSVQHYFIMDFGLLDYSWLEKATNFTFVCNF